MDKELLEKLHLFEGDYLKRSAALLFHHDPSYRGREIYAMDGRNRYRYEIE